MTVEPMVLRAGIYFVACVISRNAAGFHCRTFIRKMMYEAEGTQLEFQIPDGVCCSSSWRSGRKAFDMQILYHFGTKANDG